MFKYGFILGLFIMIGSIFMFGLNYNDDQIKNFPFKVKREILSVINETPISAFKKVEMGEQYLFEISQDGKNILRVLQGDLVVFKTVYGDFTVVIGGIFKKIENIYFERTVENMKK